MRELTLLTVAHPLTLEGGKLMRVDHPYLAPLVDGAPDLGWEGDVRLAVYQNTVDTKLYLYRYEADGEYRGVASLPATKALTEESINALCSKLVEIDSRRGYNPVTDIWDGQNKLIADANADRRAHLEAVGDKLLWSLQRSHLPGMDISRTRHFAG